MSEPIIVDEPDMWGVIRVWPYGREAHLPHINVITTFYERDGTTSGPKINWNLRPSTIEDTRRYAEALLEACRIAEDVRPRGDAGEAS